MSIEDVLRRSGGCALRRDLVATSADRWALDGMLAAGAVVRVARGAYALPGTPADVVAARVAGGLLTCVSAATRIGLPLLAPPAPHVAIATCRPAPQAKLPAGTVLHWDGRSPRPASPLRARRPLLAPVAIALVHAMGCLPTREAVALLDSAINRRLVTMAEVDALRPRSGRLSFDAIIRAADGRCQSMPETFLRLALVAAGLRVEPQALVEGVGFVDLLVERRVVVETDGYAYHKDRAAFAEDRRRDRATMAIGLQPMRYTYSDAVDATDRCVMEVQEAVRALRAMGRPPCSDFLLSSAKSRSVLRK